MNSHFFTAPFCVLIIHVFIYRKPLLNWQA